MIITSVVYELLNTRVMNYKLNKKEYYSKNLHVEDIVLVMFLILLPFYHKQHLYNLHETRLDNNDNNIINIYRISFDFLR